MVDPAVPGQPLPPHLSRQFSAPSVQVGKREGLGQISGRNIASRVKGGREQKAYSLLQCNFQPIHVTAHGLVIQPSTSSNYVEKQGTQNRHVETAPLHSLICTFWWIYCRYSNHWTWHPRQMYCYEWLFFPRYEEEKGRPQMSPKRQLRLWHLCLLHKNCWNIYSMNYNLRTYL